MWTCPKCGREFKRTNQDHYCGTAPVSVDEYILRQDESIQPKLVCLTNTIREAIPDATETIAWSMPSWKKKGYIIQFAVNKKHISVYVGQDAVAHFQKQLMDFEVYKGGIRIRRNQEIPLSLISQIAKWCYETESLR